MIRFTSDELRPLFTQKLGMQRPLILEKKLGIYLRVPDDRRPGEWLKAWAAGCNPLKDADWFTLVDTLIPEHEFSFQTFMAQSMFDAVLNDHHDLLMKPVISKLNNVLTLHKETRPPMKVYVPVGEYRYRIQWLYEQSLRHFHACVGDAERLSWRSQALHVLDQVIRLDSKRAKPADRERFDRAVGSVRDRIRSVMSDGSLRYY
ncbi:hypothetical protein K3G69_14940 [Phytobacter diazotrophicus]|uniref:hypothetical protein n=1 Tax=Phytobacter diazotrophicus TaxID=395631 RepID=UPI001C996977|nr:hypothetical protein [Phytobacter diazotrophicus]MBY6257795.1 hypothetical protein [Phytobacter diazotrophicus]